MSNNILRVIILDLGNLLMVSFGLWYLSYSNIRLRYYFRPDFGTMVPSLFKKICHLYLFSSLNNKNESLHHLINMPFYGLMCMICGKRSKCIITSQLLIYTTYFPFNFDYFSTSVVRICFIPYPKFIVIFFNMCDFTKFHLSFILYILLLLHSATSITIQFQKLLPIMYLCIIVQVEKNVFAVFFSGERAKSKILKICEAFGANRYPFTEDLGKQAQMITEVYIMILLKISAVTCMSRLTTPRSNFVELSFV